MPISLAALKEGTHRVETTVPATGEPFWFSYYPHRIDDAVQDKVRQWIKTDGHRQLAEPLAAVLADWDFVDDKGGKLAITKANLLALPPGIRVHLWVEINRDMNPKDDSASSSDT